MCTMLINYADQPLQSCTVDSMLYLLSHALPSLYLLELHYGPTRQNKYQPTYYPNIH
jgi:hypothetical protein